MPKISIVIPIFNAINTIENCINSLIFQSEKDIEILAIDDCSTDGTYEKLKEFSEKHKRLKLKRNERNLSSSVSRKIGVQISSGKYIMFLDADDTYQLNACELALKEIESKRADVVQFRVNIVAQGATPGQLSWFDSFVNRSDNSLIIGNLARKCFVEKKFGFTLWNKIYRREILKIAVEKIENKPIHKAQDLLLQFYILFYSLKFCSVDSVLYNYSYGSGITGGDKFDEEKLRKHMSQYLILVEIFNFLNKKALAHNYYDVLESVGRGLIEDNLVTLAKCAGTYQENISKDLFLANWGDGQDCFGKINDPDLKSIVSKSFKSLFSHSSYKELHKRVSFQELRQKHQDQLKSLKDALLKNTKNTIPIVMAVNEKYVPYLSVALKSIVANNKSNLFVYIFYTDLTAESISRIKSISAAGVHIDFIDVNLYINGHDLYSRAHYSVEMYYRLIIPEIFYFVPKVLYLDCDLIVTCDLGALYDFDLGGKIIGAAKNPVHQGMADYLMRKLNFSKDKYFNSGVLLIATKEFIRENIKEKCLKFLGENRDLACPDQDALNIVCDNSVKYFDLSWNFQWHHNIILKSGPAMTPLLKEERFNYDEAEKGFKIIHYTSGVKPWNSPSQKHSDYFWNYAQSSPFYFDILRLNIEK